MQYDANYWVDKLALKSHPEGGFYKEIYRSKLILDHYVLPKRFRGDRSAATAIYYLLRGGEFSAFHRIGADEGWHFYAGTTSMEVIEIKSNGLLKKHRLGQQVEEGESFFAVVEGGSWFAARPVSESPDVYALVGCTVAPGFHFDDFELAISEDLERTYPQHKELIKELCRR
ncbi:cupin domain-containing protein [Limibacter armeniacum]|uniref:cupin domain-containing protein n=1 Tax=Limibacter armeniacum TaxID=466084 RepID=UPI002FE57472